VNETGLAYSRAGGGRTLTAIYDLGWYAPTLNIFEFLCNARIWQQEMGFDGIRLVILKRPFAEALRIQPQLPAEYDFRVHDILMAATSRIPSSRWNLAATLQA
jgi:hypothetical protein